MHLRSPLLIQVETFLSSIATHTSVSWKLQMILPACLRSNEWSNGSSLKRIMRGSLNSSFDRDLNLLGFCQGMRCDANPWFWSVVGRLQPPAVVYVCLPANCESAMPVGRPALQNTCFTEYNADGSADLPLLVSCMQRLTIFCFCFERLHAGKILGIGTCEPIKTPTPTQES